MGKKKTAKSLMDKPVYINQARDFILSYQYSLRALVSTIPKRLIRRDLIDILVLGKSVIWPCRDGIVILIYRDTGSEISVGVQQEFSERVNDFLKSDQVAVLYDSEGNVYPERASFQIDYDYLSINRGFLTVANLNIWAGDQKKYYRPMFQKAFIAGWGADLPVPDRQAVRDFNTIFAVDNFLELNDEELSTEEILERVKSEASEILQSFRVLLDDANREEEVQAYLRDHPILLYPEYVEVFPKFSLGEEYQTDFVFLVRGHEGEEHVFVEIERPDRAVFRRSGDFSAGFTHAKGQLVDWDNWVTENISYISNKLPKIFKPKYHLVMGRTKDITTANRRKLRTEFFGSGYVFSTYDDIADRFEKLLGQFF